MIKDAVTKPKELIKVNGAECCVALLLVAAWSWCCIAPPPHAYVYTSNCLARWRGEEQPAAMLVQCSPANTRRLVAVSCPLQERFAEGAGEAGESSGTTPKPLGHCSYKEAVEASLSQPPTEETRPAAVVPSTAGTLPASAGPTAAAAQAAPGFSSSGDTGMIMGDKRLGGGGGPSEVEEFGGAGAGVDAPAGPLEGAGSEGFAEPQQSVGGAGGAGVSTESPRKRSFFGSLKKALGSGSANRAGEA